SWSFGSLAQLVEQRTFNPLVAGSNPARPTTNHQKAHEFTFVGFLLSGHSLVASENVRSLPVRIDIENFSQKAGLYLAYHAEKANFDEHSDHDIGSPVIFPTLPSF